MKRRWNASLWVGFLVMLAAAFSYIPIFARIPATRDFPWVNLTLFATGAALIGLGLTRAFRRPDAYRGKVPAVVLAALGAGVLGFFLVGTFHFARQLPQSAGAPRVGQKAPEFSLLDAGGNPVALSSLLSSSVGGRQTRAILLIFYRGFW